MENVTEAFKKMHRQQRMNVLKLMKLKKVLAQESLQKSRKT